ncbi:flavin-containing monooxygenase [Robertkochia aurantiaca]|uniref:flavin-containing monooxygenase n=1 Tax=Robertkochia aurantiaca TaxID=2873700 RepID=UPI001CCA25E0|nr:NAD(P)/FAD-dependent oxidoreductase [Robertkochia sp. 3YJGBD-33]
METTYDVIIVGAGLSGIGAAYHIQDKCKDRSFTILESRKDMGGTWDLFRYPGIRSDSDMYTLGFSFNPWKDAKAIADGPSILKYIKETAQKFGLDKKIKYRHKVIAADWDSERRTWKIKVEKNGTEKLELTCKFFFVCSGYYDYEKGYDPLREQSSVFEGEVIHPQQWNSRIDYTDKEVIVIGSGATAVTLVPELAKKASGVTMLQRSPTYILNLPREDALANFLKRNLPASVAHTLARWKNILVSLTLYQVSRKWPGKMRKFIKDKIAEQLGDKYKDQDFDPSYDPWDQRLCLVPDNDLFKAVRSGKARIVTDTIDTFTREGLITKGGKTLKADLIVTATGLKIKLLGGMQLSIDKQVTDTSNLHVYRGVMFSDVPNFAIAVGYTNASWTLKCDLNCHYVTRILNHMEKHGYETCTPRFDDKAFSSEPLLDFEAGYVKRALDILPKQGSSHPWKVYQNYIKDTLALKYGKVTDKYLEYS